MFHYLGAFSLSISLIVPAVASENALDEFITALNACDRGLAMPAPKSSGALSILQLLVKKYQDNSRDALASNADLKNLSTRYNGEILKSLSFAESYRRCEGQLGEKMKQAEVEVARQLELRRHRLLEQQRAAELSAVRKQQAEYHAVIAIQHCQTVTAPTAAVVFAKYSSEKQQALQLYPEITQQVLHIPHTSDVSKQNAAQWFQYCDQLLTRLLPPPEPVIHLSFATLPYAVDVPPTLLPMVEFILPPQSHVPRVPEVRSVLTAMATLQPVVTEKVSDKPLSKAEEMYQTVLAKMQGERLKVLQQEKRLPDHVNRRDLDYHKATRWQYQKNTASGSEKCVSYNFVNNQPVVAKELYGKCQ